MARQFNGTSDLIKATGGSVFGGTRVAASYSVWVKGAAQQDKVIYNDGQNASTSYARIGTQNIVGGTKCRVVVSSSAGATLLDTTSTAVILDSTWHHIGLTFDASGNWKLYIDGTLDSSGGPLTSNAFTDTWAAFGCLARNTNAQFFAGGIGDGANWSRLLTAAEVALLASGVPAADLGPDHYWPLWGTDSPEPDIGNG